MRSFTSTIVIILSLSALTLFMVSIFGVFLFVARDPSSALSCETAKSIFAGAVMDTGGQPTGPRLRRTHDLDALEASSPALWFALSTGSVFLESNKARRPSLPFAIPDGQPEIAGQPGSIAGDAELCAETFSLASGQRVLALIANAEPTLNLSRKVFVEGHLTILGLLAGAFATFVAAGVLVSARVVQHHIRRVTAMAMAIDTSAPEGTIPLTAVPRELLPLARSLNATFNDIADVMRRQRRFLSNTAHELRTPIAILRAKIEGVADGPLKSALILDIRRITSLVSAMLDLARLQNARLTMGPVDLALITRDVLADFAPLALDKNVELSLVSQCDGPILVTGAEAAIHSAIANLVGNALVHAHGAKSIVAQLTDMGTVSICDDGVGSAATGPGLQIADAGAGREAATDRHYGTGFGLAIVKEILAAHNGGMAISATPRGGTTIRLEFRPVRAPS